MTRNDADAVLSKVTDFWPKIDWPPDVRREFARRVANLPIERGQALAAMLNVRMSKPFRTCEPSDLLGPLEAVARPSASRGGSGGADNERIVKAELNRDSEAFQALCEELHRAMPNVPAHYRQARQGYWMYPPARDWLAARLSVAPPPNSPR